MSEFDEIWNSDPDVQAGFTREDSLEQNSASGVTSVSSVSGSMGDPLEVAGSTATEWEVGATPVDDAVAWLNRFIITTGESDIRVLALWAQHTWLMDAIPASPRLLIDSIMPGSGKTTTLEHLQRLCRRPVLMSTISSESLLTNLAATKRTIMVDEVDRALSVKKDTTEPLIGILNSGYKKGATRPVNVFNDQTKRWEPEDVSTYAPCAMAGNSPHLPDDARSRSVRVFLLPDTNGEAEETDWIEDGFESEAKDLGARLEQWAKVHAADVKGARPSLPEGCRGRLKERWVAFARIAHVLGGDWPGIVTALIVDDIENDKQEREEGLRGIPPTMQAVLDASEIIRGHGFMISQDLVEAMVSLNPERWGENSGYGKRLTAQRLGRMLSSSNIRTRRNTMRSDRRRGYREQDIEGVASKVRPPLMEPDTLDTLVTPDASGDIEGELDPEIASLLEEDDNPSVGVPDHPEVTMADLKAFAESRGEEL